MGDVLENREDLKTYLSVTKSDTTIIKLTASWCGPCKRLDKEAIASAFGSNAAADEKLRKIREEEANRFAASTGRLASQNRSAGLI